MHRVDASAKSTTKNYNSALLLSNYPDKSISFCSFTDLRKLGVYDYIFIASFTRRLHHLDEKNLHS